MVRVLLAEDHEAVRRALRELIEDHPECTVCAEAADGMQAVAAALRFRPDVAMIDVSMPLLDGIAAARQLRCAAPGIEIGVVTMHQSTDLVRLAVSCGIRTYVMKYDAAAHLVPAILALARHKPYFTTQLTPELYRKYRSFSARSVR
jgi:DNA-binding NarL/FixJ family response regulator